MLLRPKTGADADGCVAVMRQTHEVDGYPRYWPGRPARFLGPRQETDAWVVVAEDRIVGHVALHDAAGEPTLPAAQRATGLAADRLAVVARLMVAPDLRRSGVGRLLLDTAVRRARAAGRRPVLDVLQESAGAITFYERAGWRRLEPLTLALGRALPDDDLDLPPLQLWVYLAPSSGDDAAPCSSGTTSAG